MRTLLLAATALALTACGPGEAPPAPGENPPSAIAGTPANAVDTAPECALFTADEIAGYQGEPVKPGEKATGGGCIWYANGDEGATLVAVLSADYAEIPTGAPNYKAVPELGEKGFAVPELGGYAAGVIKDGHFFKASIAGKGASDATAVALVKEATARWK